jgi:sugar phosphate isomerase/epimerase
MHLQRSAWWSFLLAIVLVNVIGAALGAEPSCECSKGLPYSLFAFDNGLGGIAEPAKVLKELGYGGMGASGLNISPLVQQYQAAGLKVFSTYFNAMVDQTPGYEPQLKTAVEQLKGTGVVLWLTLRGGKPGENDDGAAAVVREIAALAEPSGLQVALYPHTGFYAATTADALRVARKVDRKNVGVSINLCHELMTGGQDKLDETIRDAMPLLFMVSINGADRKQPGYGWDHLIQPLGRGDFDVYRFLKKLKAAGYRGPIGLQCYAVAGDKAENLRQSMKAWKDYSERLAGEETK